MADEDKKDDKTPDSIDDAPPNDEGADDTDEGESGDGEADTDPDHDLAKTQRQLRRARADAKRWREIAQGKRKPDTEEPSGDRDPGPDFRTAAAVASGVAALQGAGYGGSLKRARRLVATADLTGIEPGVDGLFDPDDFGDVIEDIREEFPELFKSDDDKVNGRRGTPNFNRGNRSGDTGAPKLTDDEKFAKRILGAAGYVSVADKIGRGARST